MEISNPFDRTSRQGGGLTVCKHDVGHSREGVEKVRFSGDINVTAFELNTHGDHGDQYRRKDTDEGCYLLASEIILDSCQSRRHLQAMET